MEHGTGTGCLKINKKYNEEIQNILKILDTLFAEVCYTVNEKDSTAFDVDFIIDPEINYDSRDYDSVFDKVAPFVESGEVCISLDNGYQGKYVFENGKWRDKDARIVYMDTDDEQEFVAQIMDIFYDCLEKKLQDPEGFTYPLSPDEDGEVRENLKSMMKNWEVFE